MAYNAFPIFYFISIKPIQCILHIRLLPFFQTYPISYLIFIFYLLSNSLGSQSIWAKQIKVLFLLLPPSSHTFNSIQRRILQCWSDRKHQDFKGCKKMTLFQRREGKAENTIYEMMGSSNFRYRTRGLSCLSSHNFDRWISTILLQARIIKSQN